ncbi:MAG: hypothetical protein V2A58_13185 [Planctomycetota bacterium]
MHAALEERLGRLRCWFARENDRPLLGFFPGSQYPLHRYKGARRHLPDGRVGVEDVVVEDYLSDYEEQYRLHEEAGGDLVWSAAPFYGLPWVEAALGCGVTADFETGSSRAEAPTEFAGEVRPFSEENPWVRKLGEFYAALNARSRRRYPVGVTLMRGPADLLSALYGGERFLFRMMEAPEEVKAAAERVTDFWIAFGKWVLAQVESFHGGTGAFFYSLWCPGETIWFQEDASALLSPALYEEFIEPCDRRIAESFEHTVVHLHPARFLPTGYLVRSAVSVIEIHRDRGGPSAEELEGEYRRVLEAKPLFIWGDLTEEDLAFVFRKLPHRGLAVNAVVRSAAEAGKLWERWITGR